MSRTSRRGSEIEPYLVDESRLGGGCAEEVGWPSSAEEAAAMLAAWNARELPVTVSGGGTGVVGGRVPRGGAVLATDRLNRVLDLRPVEGGALLRVQAGVSLAEVQRVAAEAGLLYPPDPTESGCLIGGNLATNASGARSLRFGSTRRWVEAVRVALVDGSSGWVRRGDLPLVGASVVCDLFEGRQIALPVPRWRLPATTKCTAGYHSSEGMDLVDLLVGSEGTLCVFLEAELRVLAAPAEILSGLLFFEQEARAFDFVGAARRALQPWALELIGAEALALLREQGTAIPAGARAAIFFEQGIAAAEADRRDDHWEAWLALAERSGAAAESWLADSAADDRRFRDLRHAIPATINETLSRRGVRKVSTDTAVPRGRAPELIRRYRRRLDEQGFEYVVFGHAGDDHVHVNILPRDAEQMPRVESVYREMVEIAAEMGGAVAAEHGLGKVKNWALPIQYGPQVIERMEHLRRVFDPALRLGRGTLFPDPADGDPAEPS